MRKYASFVAVVLLGSSLGCSLATSPEGLSFDKPRVGETWKMGSEQTIAWFSSGNPSEEFEATLFVDKQAIARVHQPVGSFTWVVGTTMDPRVTLAPGPHALRATTNRGDTSVVGPFTIVGS